MSVPSWFITSNCKSESLLLGSCHLWIIKLLIIISMDKVGFLLSPTPNFLALFYLWIIMSTYMSFCTHVTYNYYVFQQHQRINTWSRLIMTFLIFITTQVTLEPEKKICVPASVIRFSETEISVPRSTLICRFGEYI